MSELTLPVVETFASLQGESTRAGRQCFFIRLAGCNLRCGYCDTTYAQDEACGAARTLGALWAEAESSKLKLAEITGGEPLLHEATAELAGGLLARGLEVLVETNGTQPIWHLPPGVGRIMDVKLPSSGMAGTVLTANFARLGAGDELKFVMANRADFDYALGVIRDYELEALNIPLIFSPVYGAVDLADLADWLLTSGHGELRMQLQQHKYIWSPDRRGV